MHLASAEPRQLCAVGWILKCQAPSDCLPHRRAKNGMCIADSSRRQTTVDHLLTRGLDIEGRDGGQDSFSKCWSNVPPKQPVVAPITLLPQFWFRRCLKPAIEKFIERNLGSLETTTEVALAQHPSQSFLRTPRRTVNRPVVITPLAAIVVAAEKHTNEPAVAPTANDLSHATRQEISSESWHTAGTLSAGGLLRNQLFRGGVG